MIKTNNIFLIDIKQCKKLSLCSMCIDVTTDEVIATKVISF